MDNAKTLAEALMAGGLRLVSGGTDNHLMLADVTALGLTGRQAEEALGRCGITVNKNMIPFDQRKPLDPSGIRIGTPALTSRGMGWTKCGRSAAGSSTCRVRPTMKRCSASAARLPTCAKVSRCRLSHRSLVDGDGRPQRGFRLHH